MSRRDINVTLRQMLDHIEEAIALTNTRTRVDLESDRSVAAIAARSRRHTVHIAAWNST